MGGHVRRHRRSRGGQGVHGEVFAPLPVVLFRLGRELAGNVDGGRSSSRASSRWSSDKSRASSPCTQEKILSRSGKIFLVGAGALGCEFLKNFACASVVRRSRACSR